MNTDPTQDAHSLGIALRLAQAQIRDLSKQLKETQNQQWQPIETYPKNGKEFLCIDTSGNIDIQAHPMVPAPEEYTHWMPLPPAPTPKSHE